MLGSFHVSEGLRELLAEGVGYARLEIGLTVPIPMALLEVLMQP